MNYNLLLELSRVFINESRLQSNFNEYRRLLNIGVELKVRGKIKIITDIKCNKRFFYKNGSVSYCILHKNHKGCHLDNYTYPWRRN